MSSTTLPRLATVGEVARILNVPVHRIEYVLRSRPHIRPGAIAGGFRCFSDDAINQIGRELTNIESQRGVTR